MRFQPSCLSESNEAMYKTLVGPWVRATASPLTALLQKWLHPMRVSRYLFSERLNPWMVPIAILAPHLAAEPHGPTLDNPWRQLEQVLSKAISKGFEQYCQVRDAASERSFEALFGA